MFGSSGTARYEADGADDEGDAGPSGQGQLFMQPEAAKKSDDDVTESSGGHNKSEIGPTERGCVTGEEADEQDDAGVDEGIEEGVPEQAEMMEVDLTDLFHAAGEQGVAYGCGEHDGDEDGVLRGFEAVGHYSYFTLPS